MPFDDEELARGWSVRKGAVPAEKLVAVAY